MAIEDGAELEGRYRILHVLGEGGMGTVYEAEHTALGRRIAIKVLHAHIARMPDAVKRFGREARAAAEIGHPNIVEVFDVGTHLGEPFLVMELLRGETLAYRLSLPEKVPYRTACRIVGYVLSALASAHAKGIIHRDLKPENVFLLADGRAPEVKLLDFGVSKFRRPGATLQQTTQEGIPLGTPAYMAPEQWMGRRDIDHRADVFAVGVMLYELLTGGLPYEGSNQGELFLEIVRGTTQPMKPSALEPGVPAALDAAVLRALDRDRDQRFASARDFLEALRAFGADAIPVVDDPPAVVEEDAAVVSTRRALRVAPTAAVAPKTRVPVEVVGTVLVVLLAIGGGGWWFSRFPSPTARHSQGPAASHLAPSHRRPIATPLAALDAGSSTPNLLRPEDAARVVVSQAADATLSRSHHGHHRAHPADAASAERDPEEVERLPVSRTFEP